MNTIQFEIWHLVSLVITGISFIVSVGWVLLQQMDKRMNAHFVALEKARDETMRVWDAKFAEMLDDHKASAEAWRSLERDFLKFRGDLPLEYVRREDFIRNQSVIEAKLDAVALHIQNLQLQRHNNNG